MASTFTQNLGLENPTPADPATLNTWGTTENTGRTLVDAAVAGILTLSVAGSANVSLTSTLGAADQSRNQHFAFTGALTGNINVLWPSGRDRMFSVTNSTTGAFTLSCGADTGGGIPAGTVIAVPVGYTMVLVSDGTNVTQRVTSIHSGSFDGATLDGATLNNPTITGTITGVLPPGLIFPYAGPTAPTGYAICAGTAISRVTFAALFAVIGTTFGVGDGVTTFNIPDLRGRFVAGLDGGTGRLTGNTSGGLNATSMAATGGEQSHTLTVAELAFHNHGTSDPGHAHFSTADTLAPVTNFAFVTGNVFAAGAGNLGIGTNITSTATTGVAVSGAGGGNAHNNVPPAIAVNYIIKT